MRASRSSLRCVLEQEHLSQLSTGSTQEDPLIHKSDQYSLRNRKNIPYKNVLFLFSLYYCINNKYVVGIKMKVSAYCFYLYYILSCQPGGAVASCVVCKHLCIDLVHRIGLIHG